jgi:AcrR family transcriptional regulator
VGSLYQYFPNKAAILFKLQADEWRGTAGKIKEIIQQESNSPLERLKALALFFVQSECQEAVFRAALDLAAPLYRLAPEALASRSAGKEAVNQFLAQRLPKASDKTIQTTQELILNTLFSAGKRFSQSPRTPEQISSYAEAMGNMFGAYLKELGAEI